MEKANHFRQKTMADSDLIQEIKCNEVQIYNEKTIYSIIAVVGSSILL